jgi:hypothetical protein
MYTHVSKSKNDKVKGERKKTVRPQMWWRTPIIPVTWEAGVGG